MKSGVFSSVPSPPLFRLLRLLAAAWLSAGLASLALRPSGAGADTFRVAGSWYWSNQPAPGPPPVGQPLGNVQPPDVPSSDLAVSMQGGSSEKETYVHIDTTAIPPGASVSNFVLTLNEDTTAPGDGFATAAAVKAYPVTAFFADGVAARPYNERPPYEKGTSVAGKRDSGSGGQGSAKWSFDLTEIVNGWLSGSAQNNGIALVGDASQSQNFEVVWAGPTTSPSVAQPPTAEGTVAPGTPGGAPPVPVENAGGGSTPAIPSSGAGASPSVTVPAATSGPGVPSIDQPVAPPANHAAVGPLASAASPAPRLRRAGSHRAPPAGLWVAGLGVIALGLFCMTVLGPGGEPSGRRRGSVLRALERRAALGGAGPDMTDAATGGAAP